MIPLLLFFGFPEKSILSPGNYTCVYFLNLVTEKHWKEGQWRRKMGRWLWRVPHRLTRRSSWIVKLSLLRTACKALSHGSILEIPTTGCLSHRMLQSGRYLLLVLSCALPHSSHETLRQGHFYLHVMRQVKTLRLYWFVLLLSFLSTLGIVSK